MSGISDYNNGSNSYGSGNFVDNAIGLSKREPDLETDAYSPLDKLTINTSLNATFGKDIYGRKICSIIKGFLEYKVYEGATARFETFIKKCNDLINENNQTKPKNCEAAVILQTSVDESELFSAITFLPQLEQLTKNYYVALRVISHREETLGAAISKVAKELEGRQIMTLIVRAHGNKDRFQLGEKSYYTTSDVNANDFAPLSPRASIILDACLTGCELAQKIASVQERSVFACKEESFNGSFLTFCCDDHGYGLTAFDQSPDQNLIARRFKYEKGHITEAIPCSVIREGVEEIKKMRLNNIKIGAEQGDANTQYNLGILHYEGRGVHKSYEEAAKWYVKAAEQGNIKAQFNLGLLYTKGQGVPQSYKQAAEWYLEAAAQGNVTAQYNLGIFYAEGQGVPQSYEEAAKWFLKAAEQGYPQARYNLGVFYKNGQGVPQSQEEAAKWYRRAADQGNASASYNLGILYAEWQGVLQSYTEAAKWYLRASKQGHARAQFSLAFLYEKGQGVPQSYEEAEKWYLQAAEQGHTIAQINLALLYEKGQGVPQSYEEAAKWYLVAAEQGNAIAQCNLGTLYYNGQGVTKSYTEAAEWFLKASDQGNETAKNNFIITKMKLLKTG